MTSTNLKGNFYKSHSMPRPGLTKGPSGRSSVSRYPNRADGYRYTATLSSTLTYSASIACI